MNSSLQKPTDFREMSYPPYRRGEPVALFVPCYIDQFYPRLAEATVRLLSGFGVPVRFPAEQTCCGQPAFNSGYWNEARRVASHFARCFAPFQWIICPSGSCAAMCRVFYELLDPGGKLPEVGRRVFEVCEFLVNCLGIREVNVSFPYRVTLHIGCHTRRELGVIDPPRILVESLRDVRFCPLPDAEECCGFGGTFSVKMPGISVAMGQAKAECIVASQAEWLLTTDISCLMHLEGILRRHPQGKEIRVAHVVEVLAGMHDGRPLAGPK